MPTGRLVTAFGLLGGNPKVGDWNGDTKTEIGIYKERTWYLDMNGNGAWGGETADTLVTAFDMSGWTYIVEYSNKPEIIHKMGNNDPK